VQSIDTWFISRKIGMLFEANVGGGKLVMTTMDITRDLDKRIVARQMRASIVNYMKSDKFKPKWTLDASLVADLFTKVAGQVNMYTKDSPDELKPKLK
nr:beta-glucuronidase [Bacteroidaceae bacterium]